MALYITSQVMVAIGTALDLLSKTRSKKKGLLFYLIFSNLFFVLSYVFLQKPLPAIANSIFFCRCVVYYILNLHNKSFAWYIPAIIIQVAAFIPALITFWNGPLDIIMLVSIVVIAFGLALKNFNIVRIILILNNMMWAIYNFTIKGYVNMCCDILGIIVLICSMIYQKKRADKNKKQA